LSSVLRLLGEVVITATSEGVAHVRAIGGVDGTDSAEEVLLEVDTHLDVNVAVALDGLGRRLGVLKVPTTTGAMKDSCVGLRTSVP
jgi:hypothetical protein